MSGISDVIRAVAPTIATVLGGPLAGAAVSFIADKMGVSEPTIDKIQQILAGSDPVRLKELELDFQKFMADNGIKVQLAQLEVNKAEAQSTSLFVAGWRPFIGWTCGIAFCYSYVILPFLLYLTFSFGSVEIVKQIAGLPRLDLGEMLPVLFGMLGLGAYRTVEKVKGVKK